MGISGLLPWLKDCANYRKMNDYQGRCIGIDMHGWVHKILKGPCGYQFLQGTSKKYNYVDECLKRIKRIMKYNIKVIIIFDGHKLSNKQKQQNQRQNKRNKLYQDGLQMIKQNNINGYKKILSSINITSQIIYPIIKKLIQQNISFIVSPYQADAQLAYLSRKNIIDVVITQDSDLLLFGALRILYKLDWNSMTGLQLCLDQINQLKIQLRKFTHCMFIIACILSGCDYLKSIQGIGIKTSFKLISKVTTFSSFLKEISKKYQIPQQYQNNFFKAFLTFRFQRVYCPQRRKCVQINERQFSRWSKECMTSSTKQKWSEQVVNSEVIEYWNSHRIVDFTFLGAVLDRQVIQDVSKGLMNPQNYEYHVIKDKDKSAVNSKKTLKDKLQDLLNRRSQNRTIYDCNDYNSNDNSHKNINFQKYQNKSNNNVINNYNSDNIYSINSSSNHYNILRNQKQLQKKTKQKNSQFFKKSNEYSQSNYSNNCWPTLTQYRRKQPFIQNEGISNVYRSQSWERSEPQKVMAELKIIKVNQTQQISKRANHDYGKYNSQQNDYNSNYQNYNRNYNNYNSNDSSNYNYNRNNYNGNVVGEEHNEIHSIFHNEQIKKIGENLLGKILNPQKY